MGGANKKQNGALQRRTNNQMGSMIEGKRITCKSGKAVKLIGRRGKDCGATQNGKKRQSYKNYGEKGKLGQGHFYTTERETIGGFMQYHRGGIERKIGNIKKSRAQGKTSTGGKKNLK